jgi:hypothetical protein
MRSPLTWTGGRFERIIDVGGTRGTKSLAILKHHPNLTALVIDRPQVVKECRRARDTFWDIHVPK